MGYAVFVNKYDSTYLNVNGKLIVEGKFSINRGCRFDIGKNAIVRLGSGSYINSFTKIVIRHGLEIGKSCAVSWDCQFLDENFHTLEYPDKKKDENKVIVISDRVWIGSRVSILAGTYIAQGSVVASNSVVKGKFLEENVLIAGNPAVVVKKNVIWK